MTPRLIVVTDVAVAPLGVIEPRIEHVLHTARPGSVVVQLRDLLLPVRERLALGERLVAACRRHGQWLVVNDRVDLALLLGADGVHLGEHGVSTEDARALLPSGTWISRACHDPDAVASLAADAVLLSPAAAPRKGRPALGAEGFHGARERLDALPRETRPRLYALGGIDASNVATFMDGLADGVAVIGAALDGRDPEPLVRGLGILRGN